MNISRSNGTLLACAALAVLALLLLPDSAFAAVTCQHSNDEGVTQRIVSCFDTAVATATQTYLSKFYGFMRPIVMAALTISAALYGTTLVATGKMHAKEAFIWLFKIAAVFYFTANFAQVVAGINTIIEGLLNIVTSAVAINNPLGCRAALHIETSLWGRVDCAIEKLIGIGPDVVIKAGILAFIGKILFSGAVGGYIFVVAIAMVLTLLFSIARSLYIFLNAKIMIVLIATAYSIIAPTIFFKVTRPMTDACAKLIVSAGVQVLALAAYLTMFIFAFNIVVFTGDYSLYRAMAGPASQAPNFSMTDYLEQNHILTDQLKFDWALDLIPKKTDPKTNQETIDTGVFGKIPGVNAGIKAISELKFGVPMTVIDLKLMAQKQGTPDTKKFLSQLAIAFISALIMAYIWNAMLKYIPDLGFEISSGYYETANLGQLSTVAGEDTARGLLSKMEMSARDNE